jgi:hypothetical protein
LRRKNTRAPRLAAGLYYSEDSLIETAVILASSTLAWISVERAFDFSRFSMSSMFSKISPSCSLSCFSKPASRFARVILNSLDY